jgi:hypothetical protein
MKMLIKFLIYELKTIDGTKGSAFPLLYALEEQHTQEFLDRNLKIDVSDK